MKTRTINLQRFTKFPIKIIEVADREFPDIFILTPHRGLVQVKLKEEHYPFIFGSVTQTDRHASEVIEEIQKVEEGAVDFLIEKWRETL